MKLCLTPLLFGVLLPLGAQTHPSDAQGHAEAMHHETDTKAVPSTVLVVQTATQTLNLTLADLQAMPQTTLKVHNEHNKADETYSGPKLADVLAKAGLVLTTATQHDLLRMYLIATGTDGYFVVYSAAEVEPGLHKAEVIVAIAQEGRPLGRAGSFQLIDAQDTKPARWVRDLTRLSLKTQTAD